MKIVNDYFSRRNAKKVSALLDQLRSGDLSTAAFYKQHQINKHTFRYWAHVWREFERALEYDKERTEIALTMTYSFFAICKKHEVKPYAWLMYTLQNINTTPYKNLTNLNPQNYKQTLAD